MKKESVVHVLTQLATIFKGTRAEHDYIDKVIKFVEEVLIEDPSIADNKEA